MKQLIPWTGLLITMVLFISASIERNDLQHELDDMTYSRDTIADMYNELAEIHYPLVGSLTSAGATEEQAVIIIQASRVFEINPKP